jgi:membrane protease YdiL (CAAX protease family)
LSTHVHYDTEHTAPKSRREMVRVIALTTAFPVMGLLICYLAEVLLKIEIPRLTSSLINLIVVGFAAFFLFPRVLGIPFGKTEPRELNKRIGFYIPNLAWRHIVLGATLASCTLSGMLIASMIVGGYELDFSNITLTQLVFSLNPGIWEEFFYRGIMMIALLRFTKSLKRAAVIQVVLFGLCHIKGTDIQSLIDAVSVTILGAGFTYAAYKTRTLVAGIMFHYLHDAFLFFVQLPGGVYTGPMENAVFYAALWSLMGLGCLITRFAAERFKVRAPTELYAFESVLTVRLD